MRGDVLDAVNRLLDERGSDDTLTMRAVAKEVGVSAPSIYLHFADKAELVWAALSDKYGQLAERMRVAGESVDADDPRAALRAQASAYCRFALDHPGHYQLMFEMQQPSVEPDRLWIHPSRQVSSRLREGLKSCVDAGYSLSLPPLQAGHTLWTGLHGIVSLQHSLSFRPADMIVVGLADGLVDILVSADRVDEPTTPADTDVERRIGEFLLD